MNYIRNDDATFTCPDCGVIKNHQSTMYYHMKQHRNEYIYECGICKKGFMQKSMLEKHCAVHHSSTCDSEHYTCPKKDCTHSSKTKGNLRIHIIRVHLADEVNIIYKRRAGEHTAQHRCRGCRETFKSLTAFYYHAAGCIDCDDIPIIFRDILDVHQSL